MRFQGAEHLIARYLLPSHPCMLNDVSYIVFDSATYGKDLRGQSIVGCFLIFCGKSACGVEAAILQTPCFSHLCLCNSFY